MDIGPIGAEISEFEIFTFCLYHRLDYAIFSVLWPSVPKFPKISEKYLGTSYEPVSTAIGRRLEAHEACHMAKFRAYRFKDGGDMKFRKFTF